ncbi:sugar kinase [Streptomyces sp. NPDC051322]|uniref:sugar kinase n=1 Tax=Streptomyces sp. NPDC051322 TaxID=3154645 RepID=UPI00344DF42C
MSSTQSSTLQVPARTAEPGPDILALGEPLVEFSAESDGALEDSVRFTLGFGGDTSNMVVAAARSGARTGYLTRIGDDAFGRLLTEMWTREGVDVTGVVREPGANTGLYFITRHAQEGHRFTYRRAGSAASRLGPDDISGASLACARLLHVSGISQAVSASACDAALHGMRIARSVGTLVSYDPNYRPALWSLDRARATILHSASLADILLPSLEEGRLITGQQRPEDVVACFARQGPAVVVLKMGDEGVLLSESGRLTRIPAHRVRAVDATGAGDTFDGAFAARLVAGDTVSDAAGYAVVAAALTTTGQGAVGPIPHRDLVAQARVSAL